MKHFLYGMRQWCIDLTSIGAHYFISNVAATLSPDINSRAPYPSILRFSGSVQTHSHSVLFNFKEAFWDRTFTVSSNYPSLSIAVVQVAVEHSLVNRLNREHIESRKFFTSHLRIILKMHIEHVSKPAIAHLEVVIASTSALASRSRTWHTIDKVRPIVIECQRQIPRKSLENDAK